MNSRSRRSVNNLPHISRAASAAFLMMALAIPAVVFSEDANGGAGQPALEAAGPESTTESGAIREGMKIAIDPETGQIIAKPVREQNRELSVPLANALSRSTEDLHVFDLPNGGKGVNLDNRFQHVYMVQLKPDGSFETVCVNHKHQAEKFLRNGSSAKASKSGEK